MSNFINTEAPVLFLAEEPEPDGLGISVPCVKALLPIEDLSLEELNSKIPGFNVHQIVYLTRPEHLENMADAIQTNEPTDLMTQFRLYKNADPLTRRVSLVIEETLPYEDSILTDPFNDTPFMVRGDLFIFQGRTFFSYDEISEGIARLPHESRDAFLGLIDDIVRRLDYTSHKKVRWIMPAARNTD